jgi:ribosomal protein L7/L12
MSNELCTLTVTNIGFITNPNIIKVISDLTCLGLKEAEHLCRLGVINFHVKRTVADVWRFNLEAAGATVEIR